MHRLRLPEPRNNIPPAFGDPAAAEAWLAELAAKPVTDALAAILEQIDAIDGGTLSPPQALALLNLLRTAAVPRQAIAEGQFTRKALPMLADEARDFDIAQQLWTRMGIAYLRLAPQCTPANRCLPLHRAACAFRVAQYCHFLAARSCSPQLDELLLSVLVSAEANGVLRRPLADPDYPQYGKGTVSGQLAWALLVKTIDPYHLQPIQLQVANRAFSRWRELVAFEADGASVKSDYRLELAALFGCELPPGIAVCLNIRSVARKLAQRIQALKAGESPEALKLGRVLSAGAAIRLLKDIERHLHPHDNAGQRANGEIKLVFGGENAYALLKKKTLNSLDTEGASDRSTSYQRMEKQGFDRVSHMPTEVTKKLDLPSERWIMTDGIARRPKGSSSSRLLAPCLVAARIDGEPQLGFISSLQSDADGTLTARLTWLTQGVEAGTLKRLAPRGNKLVRVPAFVLNDSDGYSLIVPTDTGARLGVKLELSGVAIESLVPAEILERGTDFVHYTGLPE
jgi:hypothetical protein